MACTLAIIYAPVFDNIVPVYTYFKDALFELGSNYKVGRDSICFNESLYNASSF